MKIISAQQICENLSWRDTIEALRLLFQTGCEAPVRHHHTMSHPNQQDATMLLMPAWIPGRYAGLKLVNVYPDNPNHGVPAITGAYILMDGPTGQPLAVFDASELTARRTAAASALASWYLSRAESANLLIVGSGKQAASVGFAHAVTRPISEIRIWARNVAKARLLQEMYSTAGFSASVENDLEAGSQWADIISCSTMSTSPLIQGKWLRPGTHVDLIGGYKPNMRETDDEVMRIGRIFADTRAGVLAEAGDILLPLRAGVITQDALVGELSELTRGDCAGRRTAEDITVFKSVGAALEDLAAAIQCYEKMQPERP